MKNQGLIFVMPGVLLITLLRLSRHANRTPHTFALPLILSYTSFISNVNSVNEVHGKEQTEFQLNNFFIIVI